MRYKMELRSVGNPDHGQYFGHGVLSPTITVEADDIPTMVAMKLDYITEHNLGGATSAPLRSMRTEIPSA